MAWVYLFVAGALEVGWAVSLKKSEGFRHLVPSVVAVVLMVLSIWLLALALRELPVGTAYAVWTGIGAIGTVLVGMTLLGEPRDAIRLVCLGLIATGIVGLKLFAK